MLFNLTKLVPWIMGIARPQFLGNIGQALGISRSDTDYENKQVNWTPRQLQTEEALGAWLNQRFSHGRGGAATGYEGQLPGTAGMSSIQQQLYDQAQSGQGLWGNYQNYTDPNRITQRVNERSATREQYLAPRREMEDALLKEKMANMGLTHSSDMLKAQMDQNMMREASDTAFRQSLFDTYEALGLQMTPTAINQMIQVGEMSRQIQEAGLQAEFDEFIRTQPEYSPILQAMFGYLGLTGVTTGKGSQTGTNMGTKMGAGFGFGKQ